MTRNTNARIAGFTYLVYIAVAYPSFLLLDRATSGKGVAAGLTSLAQHVPEVRIAIVLTLLGCLSALVLAVTLYGITRDEDHELATLAMACRLAEGVLGAATVPNTLGLLWLATAGTEVGSRDAAATNAIGTLLLMPIPSGMIGGLFFAVGSSLFCYLLLRGRIVPAPLAWLGLLASALVVVALPLLLTGLLTGPVTSFMWLPLLLFEISVGLWLLIKGVAPLRQRSTS